MNLWQKFKLGCTILFGKQTVPAIEAFKSEHVPDYHIAPFKPSELRKSLDALSPEQRELWQLCGRPPLPSPSSLLYIPFWSSLYRECTSEHATPEQKEWYRRQQVELINKMEADEHFNALFGHSCFMPEFLKDKQVKCDVQPLTEHIPFIPVDVGLKIDPDTQTYEIIKMRLRDPNITAPIIKDRLIPLLGLLVEKRLNEQRAEVSTDWMDYEMDSEREVRIQPDNLGTFKWVPELKTQLEVTRPDDGREIIVQERKHHISLPPILKVLKVDGLELTPETFYKLQTRGLNDIVVAFKPLMEKHFVEFARVHAIFTYLDKLPKEQQPAEPMLVSELPDTHVVEVISELNWFAYEALEKNRLEKFDD